MTLSDAADWAKVAAAAIAAVALLITLVSLFASMWTARGPHQRALRDRLRKPLRELSLECDGFYQREGSKPVGDMKTAFSFQPFDRIHEDGLISPSRKHIEQLKPILRGIRTFFEVTPENFTTLPTDEDRQRVLDGFERLDAATKKYLKALGRMDNAGPFGYLTYARYRFPPLWRTRFVMPKR